MIETQCINCGTTIAPDKNAIMLGIAPRTGRKYARKASANATVLTLFTTKNGSLGNTLTKGAARSGYPRGYQC